MTASLPVQNTATSSQQTKKVVSHNGFSWIVASVFVIGETAGSGLVAMPNAISNTGIFGGTILLCIIAVVTAHTANQLGSNWLLMQRRWKEYLNPCRNPYPEMARRALGNKASWAASASIHMTLFGGAAVFSLLAARNISELLSLLNVRLHFCILLFAIALFLWPLMMLRSPMHFWQVSIGAALSTTVAVGLIIIGISIDAPICFPNAYYPTVTVQGFSLGFGTIVFAYGGHPVLPTIQHDMRKPQHFFKTVILSYTGSTFSYYFYFLWYFNIQYLMFLKPYLVLLLLYAPVALGGFAVYGSSLSDSIISSVQSPVMRQMINIMITLHVLFSILIIINPLHQGAEEWMGVKHEFGIGRVLVRSGVLLATTLSAATLPNFGVFLDLVGSSSMTLLALVFPGLFALFLEAGEKKRKKILQESPTKVNSADCEIATFKEVIGLIDKGRLLREFSIIGLGLVCGVASTVNSLVEATQSSLAIPCYIQLFMDTPVITVPYRTGITCCGLYGNITANEYLNYECLNKIPN